MAAWQHGLAPWSPNSLHRPCVAAGVGKCFSIHTRWDVTPAGGDGPEGCRLTVHNQIRWERFHPVKGPAGKATAKECAATYLRLKVGATL